VNRLIVSAISFTIATTLVACSFNKQSPPSETNNRPAQNGNKQAPASAETTPSQAQPGELQPGQASGTYTAKGEVVELKYAYAGRAVRFGSESLVILLTEKPIPAEAIAEEIKSTPLLEGEKIRGLEYAIEFGLAGGDELDPARFRAGRSTAFLSVAMAGHEYNWSDISEPCP